MNCPSEGASVLGMVGKAGREEDRQKHIILEIQRARMKGGNFMQFLAFAACKAVNAA